MGGLVCRCLLEKILFERKKKSLDLIDKFVTFGTPHRDIEFAVGHGALERVAPSGYEEAKRHAGSVAICRTTDPCQRWLGLC
jgi:hypothetical protein